jgi:hypothetical protein
VKTPVLLLALSAAPALAEPLELSLEDFKMFRQYQAAMEDARVQKLAPDKRMAAIAKNAKFKLPALEEAVRKGEAAGDIGAKCISQLKTALTLTSVGSAMHKVDVDARAEHAVAYLAWTNEDPALLEEEAATAAAQARACGVLSSVQLWATPKGNTTQRIFQALISASAAAKIQPEKIKDFADTRYIKLFEKVKNAANGDDLSQPSP